MSRFQPGMTNAKNTWNDPLIILQRLLTAYQERLNAFMTKVEEHIIFDKSAMLNKSVVRSSVGRWRGDSLKKGIMNKHHPPHVFSRREKPTYLVISFDERKTSANCRGDGKRSIFSIFNRWNIEFGRAAREACHPGTDLASETPYMSGAGC
jgi:hypothetical protein